MSHDRKMALELQAAEQEGLLCACLAMIMHHQVEERGYNQTVSIDASHCWGLDGQKLAWEPQTIQGCSHYPRASLQTYRCGQQTVLACHPAVSPAAMQHTLLNTLTLTSVCRTLGFCTTVYVHPVAGWRQKAAVLHDACKLSFLMRPFPCAMLHIV